MLTVFFMILIGFLAGILSAILGIGGGIVLLPATQLLLKFSPTTAVATTLFTVALTSFSAALGHYRQGRVNVKNALLVGSGGITGVLIGSYIFKEHLSKNTDYIQIFLALMFLFMGCKMLKELYADLKNQEIKESRAWLKSPVWLVVLGAFTGMLTGMLGLGGGFIMVPALIWLFGVGSLEAVGTTLLAMFPIAVIGAIVKIGQGFVNINAGLIIGLGSILGAQIGVKVSALVKPYIFKAIFSLIFIYLAVFYLLSLFK